MNTNPYVFSALGLLAIIVQLFINLNVARRILPAVRKAHELPLDKRIQLIAGASQRTHEIKFERIIVLILIYLPIMGWLTLKEESVWPGFLFMLVTCAQMFIIWVASNHVQIVRMQVGRFNLEEAKAYLAYLEKDGTK